MKPRYSYRMLQEHLLLPRMPVEQGRERTGFCNCFCLYLQAPAQCKQAGQGTSEAAA